MALIMPSHRFDSCRGYHKTVDMVELVDTLVLGTSSFEGAGSIPVINIYILLKWV